jgi:hypothetical protein
MEESDSDILSDAAKYRDVGWNLFDAIVARFHPFMKENMSLETAEWVNKHGGWGGLYNNVKNRVKQEKLK